MNPDFQYLNPYRSGNSYDRSEHIKAKLARKKSFSIQDFIDESIHPTIWRPGASVQSARTLSTWIVSQSPNDEARLYLRMGNPGNPAKEYDFLVKDLFDGKIDLSIVKWARNVCVFGSGCCERKGIERTDLRRSAERGIAVMRNVLAHNHFYIYLENVW